MDRSINGRNARPAHQPLQVGLEQFAHQAPRPPRTVAQCTPRADVVSDTCNVVTMCRARRRLGAAISAADYAYKHVARLFCVGPGLRVPVPNDQGHQNHCRRLQGVRHPFIRQFFRHRACHPYSLPLFRSRVPPLLIVRVIGAGVRVRVWMRMHVCACDAQPASVHTVCRHSTSSSSRARRRRHRCWSVCRCHRSSSYPNRPSQHRCRRATLAAHAGSSGCTEVIGSRDVCKGVCERPAITCPSPHRHPTLTSPAHSPPPPPPPRTPPPTLDVALVRCTFDRFKSTRWLVVCCCDVSFTCRSRNSAAEAAVSGTRFGPASTSWWSACACTP